MPVAAIGATNKQLGFGPGFLVATGNTGINGAPALDNLTPLRFGVVQSVQLDFDTKIKPLYGQRVFPVLAAWSQGTVSGKLKTASICGWLFNMFMGFTTTAPNNGSSVTMDLLSAIPGTTPFTVTVANASDLGVVFQLTSVTTGSVSQQLTRVASGPVTGQYSFAAGVWTFAAADAGKAIYISYALAGDVTTTQYVWQNPLSGLPPMFGVQFVQQFGGKTFRITVPNCVSNKLSIPTKGNDFQEFEIDFEALTINESGTIATFDTLI